MKDKLGDRMKEFYESRTKVLLPRRTHTIIRIDGKAFHTYTRGLERPFDKGFVDDMDKTAMYLCDSIQGAKMAYVQSDEISILLTDFDRVGTDAWYNGNVQKIISVSASLATAWFNRARYLRKSNDTCKDLFDMPIAAFDSRVFTIPFTGEVDNYFMWRQQDCIRNSIQSVAQSLYSHKELENKNSNDLQEMCFQKGTNWNNLDPSLKRGRIITKEGFKRNGADRTRWVTNAAPDFLTNTAAWQHDN